MNEEAEVKENPDIAYIKRDDIGLVIAKGLSKLYRAQPENPVDYLAKWLLNFSSVKSEANNLLENKQKVQELKDRKDIEDQDKAREEEEAKKKDIEKRNTLEEFVDKVNTCEDPSDMLQSFTHHLQKFTGATGVYIGELIRPNKPITDDDDDKAHEGDGEEVIVFNHATPDHDFMIGKTLTKEQGLTHDVFHPPEPREGEGDAEPKDDEKAEGEGEAEAPKEEPKKVPQHKYVPEVVRENRMHFFKVPRLGSFIAVELKYQTCLTEEAFEKAFEDYLDVEQKRAEQEKEKDEYNQKLQDKGESMSNDDKEPEEKKEWPEIVEKPFESSEKRYVVCLDTLGQDREFTEEEKEFVLDKVQHYSDTWTATEIKNLKDDIQKRLKTFNNDKEYIEGELGQNLLADEEKYIDDYFDSLEEPADEATRNEKMPLLKHQFLQQKLTEGEWKDEILAFRQYRVVKFPRFWQSLFYFLGYSREEICEEGTNKLNWKKAKNKLNDGLFEKMKNYKHTGPKENDFKRYQLLNFIEKNMEGINSEDIENYSYVQSRLFKWMMSSIEMRKDDINRRREIKEKEREEREQALEDHKEWKSKREAAMEDAKTEFEAAQVEKETAKDDDADKNEGEGGDDQDKRDEEKPTFDEEEFYKTYDADNPEVKIPKEVVDDVDNDYEIVKEGDE